MCSSFVYAKKLILTVFTTDWLVINNLFKMIYKLKNNSFSLQFSFFVWPFSFMCIQVFFNIKLSVYLLSNQLLSFFISIY